MLDEGPTKEEMLAASRALPAARRVAGGVLYRAVGGLLPPRPDLVADGDADGVPEVGRGIDCLP